MNIQDRGVVRQAAPLFERERLAVEWFLVPSLVESYEGAVGPQLPSVGGVGELEFEEAPDFVAASRREVLLDPAVQVALHEVVGAAEADLLFLDLSEHVRVHACQPFGSRFPEAVASRIKD
jgi:hypothetical protein